MVRFVPLAKAGDEARVRAEIEAIFFESAATKTFAGETERAAYLDLWLGRYLRHCPEECFAALDDGGAVVGYLAGSLISDHEPLPGPNYYAFFPGTLVEIFPAHLHVNVRADWRGREIGAKLLAAFREHCRAGGIGGFHAVTRAGTRAAAFFMRCGLAPKGEASWRGRTIVFLAEAL